MHKRCWNKTYVEEEVAAERRKKLRKKERRRKQIEIKRAKENHGYGR